MIKAEKVLRFSLKEQEKALRGLVQELAGKQLPTERELSAHLGMSRGRVRTILAVLREEGLIEQRQGSGTFATHREATGVAAVAVRIDAALKLGDDPFFSLLVEQLQAALQRAGIACTLERMRAESLEISPTPTIAVGLLGEELLRLQRRSTTPLVTLLLGPDTRPGRKASVFHLWDFDAGILAAEYLLHRECRSMVFVGRKGLPAVEERFAGAQRVAQRVGVPVTFSAAEGLNYAAGIEAGQSLTLPEGAGIIAANDWLAVGLRAGLSRNPALATTKVPMASFDGLPTAASPLLEIMSLRVPIELMAADAVAEVVRLSRSEQAVGRSVRYLVETTEE
jgi:DNA-binding LacI/PurR family transcriptional regulator